MDEHLPRGPLTAAEFFGLDLEGVTLTAAHIGTGLAYTTILRIRDRGPDCDPGSVRKLSAWTRALPAAQAAGVWIDAARTLGLDVADLAAANATPAPADVAEHPGAAA